MKKLRVIDDFPLGLSIPEYDSVFSELHIEKFTFLSTNFLMNYNFTPNSIEFFFTENFDLKNYKGDFTQHLGLLQPGIISGTNNIISFAVLLVHTERPIFLLSENVKPLSNDEICISQNISTKVIDHIVDMYISKYGKPKETIINPRNITYYNIKGVK